MGSGSSPHASPSVGEKRKSRVEPSTPALVRIIRLWAIRVSEWVIEVVSSPLPWLTETAALGICLYCQKSEKLSGEHVLSDWIASHVPRVSNKSMHTTSFVTPASRGKQLVKEVRRLTAGDVISRKLKIVCKQCNNVWMGRIVELSKPDVRPLLSGIWFSLSPDACARIATWAALSAMTWERADAATIASSRFELDHMYLEKSPPPGWRIWLGTSETLLESEYWHRGMRLMLPDPVVGPPCDTSLSYFAVGQMVFIVAGSRTIDLSSIHFTGDPPFASIWPRPNEPVIAPSVRVRASDGEQVMAMLTNYLARFD